MSLRVGRRLSPDSRLAYGGATASWPRALSSGAGARSTPPTGGYLRVHVVACIEMLAPSVRSPESGFKLAVARARGWRRFVERRRKLQLGCGDLPMTRCFGSLTDRDEMVLSGLAASVLCPPERGQGRS